MTTTVANNKHAYQIIRRGVKALSTESNSTLKLKKGEILRLQKWLDALPRTMGLVASVDVIEVTNKYGTQFVLASRTLEQPKPEDEAKLRNGCAGCAKPSPLNGEWPWPGFQLLRIPDAGVPHKLRAYHFSIVACDACAETLTAPKVADKLTDEQQVFLNAVERHIDATSFKRCYGNTCSELIFGDAPSPDADPRVAIVAYANGTVGGYFVMNGARHRVVEPFTSPERACDFVAQKLCDFTGIDATLEKKS